MKTLRQFLAVMGLITYFLLSISAVSAATPVKIFPLAGPSAYGGVPAPTGTDATQQFSELVYSLVMNARYILGAIAIGVIVFSGIMMVTGQGNEEVYGKSRKSILFAFIGLAIVGLSGELAKIFYVACPSFTPPGETQLACTPGGFLKDPNALIRAATMFSQRTQIIIVFIKYLIGSVAVFLIVRNGLRMVAMGSAEDKIAIDKKNLVYTIIGLILIVIADNVITKSFYKLDLTRYPTTGGAQPAINLDRSIQELVGFTNFAVSLVAPIAVLVLLAGGVMYITAGGQDDKMTTAKRMITAAIIGIIIIYGAFAIVSTVVSGAFPQT